MTSPTKKKVVIAGANSFVASHFVHELLVQGFKVIALVRGNDSASAEVRMDQALRETMLDHPLATDNMTVFDYRLLDDHYALTDVDLKNIFAGDVDYFHFAASLKFDHRSKEEIFNTNIDGLKNALRINHNYATRKSRFFFISTAYSCGKFSGLFEEKFYPNEEIHAFRNYYEQSKRLAENVLQNYRIKQGVNAHVIRLSQVVGNSLTGVTRTEYGIFDFAKRIHALAKEYPHQSVRIHADPNATQNLIPIDTVINDLMSIVKHREVPVVMNFVADRPMQNRKIIQGITDLLPIKLIPDKDINPEEMNKLEKMVLAGMAFTGSYIDTDIEFDTRQRDKVISVYHREINESSLFAMLAYYLDLITEEDVVKSEP